MRKVTVLLALAALHLSVLWLVAEPGTAATQEAEPSGLRFTVHCSEVRTALESGDSGALTCTMNITGLPDPLQGQISVTLSTADDVAAAPGDPAPSDTVVASEMPIITPGAPSVVSQQLPIAPPAPLAISPHVPQEPPKSL